MLGDDFLKGLDEYVKRDLQYWSKWNLNKDGKIVWNYDNAHDFWFGHTIGMATRSAIQIFIDIYKRKPSQLADLAIIDTISDYASQSKQAFEHLK